MTLFSSDDLKKFLIGIDEELDRHFELLIIGGTAASLGYGISDRTRDIDTYGIEDFSYIERIGEKVREKTGLDIPISQVSVADAPYNYKERLNKKNFNFKNLEVLFPEEHDLALMKIMRGDEHDFQHIEQLNRKVSFDYKTLMDRYLNEMTHIMGEKKRIDINFLVMIERLFGDKEVKEAEKLLGFDD